MTDDTKKLTESLGEIQGKAKTLNDGLKTLSTDGFDKLSRVLARAASGQGLPARRPAGEIVAAETSSFLKSEMSSLLQDILGGPRRGSGMPETRGMNIVINNNAGASVTARETTGLFNQKQLEITIDQMVAQALSGGRQTSGVMRTLFGLAPGLLGR